MATTPDKRCENCRYWDVHSLDMLKGDCRAPEDHRYWKVPMPNGTYAMMDSFEGAVTGPNYSCQAWRAGQTEGTLDLRT